MNNLRFIERDGKMILQFWSDCAGTKNPAWYDVPFEKEEKLCVYCKLPIAIRNPSGRCDHLYYPELAGIKVEKKEPRKLAEIMDKVAKPGHCWSFPELASAAIDAVTQCYEEWVKDFVHKCNGKDNARSFPEYLKEKML